MSILDIIINAINWILQNTILRFMPKEFSLFPLNDFREYLMSFNDFVIDLFSSVDFFIPAELLFALVVIVFTAEFALFNFRSFLWLIKIIRG